MSSQLVFRDQLLNVTNGATITSSPIPMRGNKVVLSSTVINADSATGTAVIEASYDGLAWSALSGSTSLASFGNAKNAVGSVSQAFVRVKATVTAGTTLFDAWLAFSEQ